MLGIARRRWPLFTGVLAVFTILSAYVGGHDYSERKWKGTSQFYIVSDLPSGHTTTAASILASDSEARRIAFELTQIGATNGFAHLLARVARMPARSLSDDVSASSRGRLVTITILAGNRLEALRLSRASARAVPAAERIYIGREQPQTNPVRVVQRPTLSRTSGRHIATTFLLRVVLGALVAAVLALAWEYFDDSIYSANAVDRWLGAPVLAEVTP